MVQEMTGRSEVIPEKTIYVVLTEGAELHIVCPSRTYVSFLIESHNNKQNAARANVKTYLLELKYVMLVMEVVLKYL